MRSNPVKEKLKNGGIVIGTFCPIPSPLVVEVLGLSGLDFVIVDSEHGPIGPETAEAMYRAAESVGITPVTRIGENSQQVIQKFLDAGSLGVQTPLVNTREEARRVVDAVKYPPMGKRGLAGTRASWYGLSGPLGEYVEMANRETLVVVQVETLEAVKNIDEILSVEGTDVVFMGPTDLSSVLGMAGQTRDPKVRELIEQLGKKAVAAGKAAGTLARDLEEYRYWRERGFQYLCTGAPGFLAQGAQGYVRAVREFERSGGRA
ncbi:MAG: hypothetical protein HYY00_06875 [Chloroflexi bacterium]|nr:hypothetical protein [Chloroflexota bacterium]